MTEKEAKITLDQIQSRYNDLKKNHVVPVTMSFREFIKEDMELNEQFLDDEEKRAEKWYLTRTHKNANLCKA